MRNGPGLADSTLVRRSRQKKAALTAEEKRQRESAASLIQYAYRQHVLDAMMKAARELKDSGELRRQEPFQPRFNPV